MGRQTRVGWGNKLCSSFMRQYLENGRRYALHMRFRLAPRAMTLDYLKLL